MTLIGIGSGYVRAGKDVAADRLVESHGFVKMGMSDALLEHMLIINPWIQVTTLDPIVIAPGFYRAADLVKWFGYTAAKTIKDFRDYMLKDGTEGGRNFFHLDIWVNKLQDRVRQALDEGQRVVVTGVRFRNELQMIRRNGGEGWWISRPELENAQQSAADAAAAKHSSQNSLTREDFDFEIVNDGSLDEFKWRVDGMALDLWTATAA